MVSKKFSNGDFVYPNVKVDSPNVKYTCETDGQEHIESLYEYEHVRVDDSQEANTIKVNTYTG